MNIKEYYLYKQAESPTKTYTQEEFDKIIADYEKKKRGNVAKSTGDFNSDLNSRINDRKKEFNRVNYDINRARQRADGASSIASMAGGVLGWKLGDWIGDKITPQPANGFMPVVGYLLPKAAKNRSSKSIGWDPEKNYWQSGYRGMDGKLDISRYRAFANVVKWIIKLGLTSTFAAAPYVLKNNFIEGPYDAIHDNIGFHRDKL